MYIDFDAVEPLIDDAERRGLAVLGMEGFMIAEGKAYPSISRLADFSGRGLTVNESAAAAGNLFRVGGSEDHCIAQAG